MANWQLFSGQPTVSCTYQDGVLVNNELPVFPHRYKTKLCRHFEAGKCKLGGFCNFAHGLEEIQQPVRKMSKAPEALLSPPGVVKTPVRSNFSKIELLEQYLEQVYEHQKHSIEQLKFLALENLNTQSTIDARTPHLVEDNIKSLYNSAVEYSQVIKQIAAVDKFGAKDAGFSDLRSDSTRKNRSGSSEELESEICFDSDPDPSPPLRGQSQSLPSYQKEEVPTFDWKLAHYRTNSLGRDFIDIAFDSDCNGFEIDDLSPESTTYQEEHTFEGGSSFRMPSIFS
jgi:hypothetical protein